MRGRQSAIFKIFQASRDILSLFIFLFLIIYVFAVIAMMFMRDHFDFSDGLPRENFDTFVHAYLSMWIITTADSWMIILYNAMRVQWVSLMLDLSLAMHWFSARTMRINLMLHKAFKSVSGRSFL